MDAAKRVAMNDFIVEGKLEARLILIEENLKDLGLRAIKVDDVEFLLGTIRHFQQELEECLSTDIRKELHDEYQRKLTDDYFKTDQAVAAAYKDRLEKAEMNGVSIKSVYMNAISAVLARRGDARRVATDEQTRRDLLHEETGLRDAIGIIHDK